MEAARIVKMEGGENDLIDRIINDPFFNLTKEEIMDLIDPRKFTGRASDQVEQFINLDIKPLIEKNKDLLGQKVEINV
jgi:adenylosuccinate lyase